MGKIFLDCGTHMGLGFSRLSEILKIDKDWGVFGFEANPYTYQRYVDNIESNKFPTLIDQNIKVYNKAVWIHDGTIKFSLRGISIKHWESIYENDRDKTNPFYKNKWEPGLANLAADVHGLDREEIIKIPWDGGSCITTIKEEEMLSEKRNSDFYEWHQDIEVESIDISNWVKTNLSEQDLIVMKLDIEGAEYNVLEKMINDGSIDYINTLFVEWHDYQLKDKKIETEKIKSILKEKKIECIDWH
jgi:hypothetical protein